MAGGQKLEPQTGSVFAISGGDAGIRQRLFAAVGVPSLVDGAPEIFQFTNCFSTGLTVAGQPVAKLG